MIEIYKIDWDGVMQMVKILARRLEGKRIWGIPRGGQIVATLMAYHGCKLVKFTTEAEVVVDDISDTGRTLYNRTHHTTIGKLGLPTAALIIRRGCARLPEHYVALLCTEDYILFPWEDEKEAFEYMRRKENESG